MADKNAGGEHSAAKVEESPKSPVRSSPLGHGELDTIVRDYVKGTRPVGFSQNAIRRQWLVASAYLALIAFFLLAITGIVPSPDGGGAVKQISSQIETLKPEPLPPVKDVQLKNLPERPFNLLRREYLRRALWDRIEPNADSWVDLSYLRINGLLQRQATEYEEERVAYERKLKEANESRVRLGIGSWRDVERAVEVERRADIPKVGGKDVGVKDDPGVPTGPRDPHGEPISEIQMLRDDLFTSGKTKDGKKDDGRDEAVKQFVEEVLALDDLYSRLTFLRENCAELSLQQQNRLAEAEKQQRTLEDRFASDRSKVLESVKAASQTLDVWNWWRQGCLFLGLIVTSSYFIGWINRTSREDAEANFSIIRNLMGMHHGNWVVKTASEWRGAFGTEIPAEVLAHLTERSTIAGTSDAPITLAETLVNMLKHGRLRIENGPLKFDGDLRGNGSASEDGQKPPPSAPTDKSEKS